MLQACGKTVEYQPKAVTDAEYYSQQGTSAFFNDEYPNAAKHFTKALKIYQSIDRFSGIIDSRINLIETAIAIGNFNLAQHQIKQLESDLAANNNKDIIQRITLLKVKIEFQQEHYLEALGLLNPLLSELKNTPLRLNILSSKARLEVMTRSPEATEWIQKFEQSLQKSEPQNERFKALLLRTQALHKQHNGLLKESKQLIHQALSLHHKQAYRRGIAASLQQLASVEYDEENWLKTEFYLQRALNIHLWTLNKPSAIKVLKQLIQTHQQLSNEEKVQLYSEQLRKLQ